MAGQLERVQHSGGLAVTEEERMWDHLIRKARVYANGTMVKKEMQGKPDVVLAGMLSCRRLGYSEDAVTAIDVIEGHLEPPAQMYLGAVHIAGYHTRWVRTDNEAAVIEISRPGDPPLAIGFTLADAERAGLLEQWVEKKIPDGKWPDGNTRFKVEKFVIDRPGVVTPEWVAGELAAGNVKRKENWHRYPADMLAAKAAKRAVRRMAPEVLFGIADDVRRATTDVTVDVPDDDEVVDGELVDARSRPDTDVTAGFAAGGEPAGSPVPLSSTPGDPATVFERPAGAPPQSPDQAAPDVLRRAVLAAVNALDDPAKKQLLEAKNKAGIPAAHSPRFTPAHAEKMLDLIDQIHVRPAESAAGGSEAPTDGPPSAGAADGEAQAPPQPASPSAPPPRRWEPGEEPFE